MFEGFLAPSHLLLILVAVLIFLGPKRLPELGKSLGEAIRGFKDSVNSAPPPPPAQELTETPPKRST
jgi:sec-independent protein translocase protein TatA